MGLSVFDITKKIDDLYENAHHATALFPSNTNLTCTLTAAATANTFGSWAEIADSGDTKLTAAFASHKGHITSMVVESVSEADTVYEVEIGHGASHAIVSRWRFGGSTKFQSPVHQQRIRGCHVPAGEKVYYRMKSASAVADTALVHIRYFLHS